MAKMRLAWSVWCWRKRYRPDWSPSHKLGDSQRWCCWWINLFSICLACYFAMVHPWPSEVSVVWAILGAWSIAGFEAQFVTTVFGNNDQVKSLPLSDSENYGLTPLVLIFHLVVELVKLPCYWLLNGWWERVHPFAAERRLVRTELRRHLSAIDPARHSEYRAQACQLLQRSDELAEQQLLASISIGDREAAQHETDLTATMAEVSITLDEARTRMQDVETAALELDQEIESEGGAIMRT